MVRPEHEKVTMGPDGPSAVLTSLTPASTGAIGVYEFVSISTLGLFAIDPTMALTFALVIYIVLFLPPTAPYWRCRTFRGAPAT
jgi:hypothetical protein